MNIANFEDLLRAARAQPEPQRLLFVFANAALPEDSTPEQRARFQAGEGGALIPLIRHDIDRAVPVLAAGACVERLRGGGVSHARLSDCAQPEFVFAMKSKRK